MKVTVCDECGSKEIFFDDKDEQLCKECYHESSYYKKTKLEEDYGVELGKKLEPFDSFVSWDYKADANWIAKRLNESLKQFGIVATEIKYDSDSYYIGFTKYGTALHDRLP